MTDADSFDAFVAIRQADLLRTSWLLTGGDWHTAQDLLQTALVKVWPHWRRITRAGDPEAYVRRTLVTTYISGPRRRWRLEQPAELPD